MPVESTDLPQDLPEMIREAVGDATVLRITPGPRGLATYELKVRDGWPVRWLRVSSVADPYSVLSEVDRLEWIDRRLPCPKVLASERLENGSHASVLAQPPGTSANYAEHVMRAGRTIENLAQSLRFVHEIPIDNCPFSSRVDLRMRSIKRRLGIDYYNTATFTSPYNRYTAQRLYEILEETRPEEEDDVFTHGAFGLESTLIDHTGVTGVINWSTAGIADRYVDLARAVRSISVSLGPEHIPNFFHWYGLERPDPRRLDFYALLAEFE